MVYGLFFKLLVIIFLGPLCFSQASANEVIPNAFLIPDSHPIKAQLDELFSCSRVILNLKTLARAGFVFSKPRPFTHLIVAKHPAFPGYLFKLYLDAQRYHKNKPEEYFWMQRIEGALLVRHAITIYQLQDYVKVPQKWIYQLPKKPKAHKGYMTKKFILVEEDMNLLSDKENEWLWSTSNTSKEHLYAVYLVLKYAGLSDCAKPDNIPFSSDGRIAFIDTQTHGQEVPYKDLESCLCPENQNFWHQLVFRDF